MKHNPPTVISQNEVYVEVFYLTSDVNHERYDKAQEIRKYAQCGSVNDDTWELYTRICEGILTLEDLPGECSIGVLLSYIYSKLQTKNDEGLCFCKSDCDIPRKSSIADIIAIDGLAYFIDVASTFTYVGAVESLGTPPSDYPKDLTPSK